MELEALFGAKNPRIEAMRARLRELMNAEGLPYVDRSRISNSRAAQELAKWVERDHPSIHDQLFRAYFVEAGDLADRELLVRVAESVGASGEDARRVLEQRELAPAVDEDWALARRLGVTGVPTYVCDGRAIVGAQPYELLERLVVVAGAKPRAAS